VALDPVLSVLVNWKPITELNKMKLFKNDLQVTHISSRKLTMYYMQLNLDNCTFYLVLSIELVNDCHTCAPAC